MKDLKYLIAYLVPLSAILGLAWQGAWSWATIGLVFGIVPVLELFTPESKENVAEAAEEARSKRLFFDWLLYLNAPLLFGIVGWYLWIVSTHTLAPFDLLGLTLGTGVVGGACGINVAHELGHRASKGAQLLAQTMLLPVLYQHFFVEHNRGHHKNIATDADPALEAGWLLAVYVLFGWKGLAGAIAVAVVSFLLLETVNYIEHYGLRRRILPSGRPEPVSPEHSWNSDHELGRIFLYELTRHSDHHYKSTRKYQVLRHMDESPQLPFGYPTSIVMAFVPPLWFRVMNKRVRQ